MPIQKPGAQNTFFVLELVLDDRLTRMLLDDNLPEATRPRRRRIVRVSTSCGESTAPRELPILSERARRPAASTSPKPRLPAIEHPSPAWVLAGSTPGGRDRRREHRVRFVMPPKPPGGGGERTRAPILSFRRDGARGSSLRGGGEKAAAPLFPRLRCTLVEKLLWSVGNDGLSWFVSLFPRINHVRPITGGG